MSGRNLDRRTNWTTSNSKKRPSDVSSPRTDYTSPLGFASGRSAILPISSTSFHTPAPNRSHPSSRPIAGIRTLSYGGPPHLANAAYELLNNHTPPTPFFTESDTSIQRDRADPAGRKLATPAKSGNASKTPEKSEGRIRKTIRPYNELAPIWKDMDNIDQDESPRRRKIASASARMRPSSITTENLLPVQNAYAAIGKDSLLVVKDDESAYEPVNARSQLTTKSAKERQRAARKTNAEFSESGSEEDEVEEEDTWSSSSSETEELLQQPGSGDESRLGTPPIAPLLQSSPVRPIPMPRISSGVPSDELSADLRALIAPLSDFGKLKTKHPFLRRCVKKGFVLRCQREGLDVNRNDTPAEAQRRYFVVYRRAEDELDDHCVELTSWICPLCSLHGVFPSFDILRRHVQLDHYEVKETSQNQVGWCQLDLQIPSAELWNARSVTPPLLIDSAQQRDEELTTMAQGLELQQRAIAKAKARTPSPPPQPRQFETNQNQDPLGPLGIQGLPGGQYSCRPGGLKLYDHLHTDPSNADPHYNFDYEGVFGILAWQVREKEEEIYESDDVKDEYKVMHVLWMRWITLHRNFLIANYYKGVESFIDSNVSTIAMIAGWRAMRYWLLILLGNRIITGVQVAKLLVHYEEKAAACVTTIEKDS